MTPPPSSSLPGHKRLAERVNLALDTCVESQAVEFMAPSAWQDLQLGIVKTAGAMGNLRDGGIIIVGVSQRDDSWVATGMEVEKLATYDVDEIIDKTNAHFSPNVDLTIVLHEKDGKKFLVIYVAQFRDTPLVCKKEQGRELKTGTVYIRPAGKPETREVRHANEMHELLELAALIRAERLLEQIRRLGLLPGSTGQEHFKQELEGL